MAYIAYVAWLLLAYIAYRGGLDPLYAVLVAVGPLVAAALLKPSNDRIL